jgi:predicted small secreted protein
MKKTNAIFFWLLMIAIAVMANTWRGCGLESVGS